MYIIFLVCVGLWKLFKASMWLIAYFCIYAWLVLVAFGKALAGLWKLLSAAWKALEQEAEPESLEEPIEDAKPPIKAQPGPRDYHLPN